MRMRIPAVLALAGLLATGGITSAKAGHDENREANALQNAKITLSQAISIAEQHTGGRAYDAGVDIKYGATRIAVETNGPKGVQTVLVDPESGKILRAHSGAGPD